MHRGQISIEVNSARVAPSSLPPSSGTPTRACDSCDLPRRTTNPGDAMRPSQGILLADDSRDNRLLVQAYFKKTPYILDEVEDGAAAVAKLTAGVYEIVLMDIAMPIMDGYSATRAIRTMERETGRRHAQNHRAHRFRSR